jgi:hypothetical protein
MIPGVCSTRVFAINAHAGYSCRHSGACCTAGWTIPVEAHARRLLRVERLVPDSEGSCPQYDRDSARCRVHRDHGEALLPSSCHHFPRRALMDARGTFVTLSHFCPTAAALLLDSPGPLTVVDDPPAFPAARDYDGLDAVGHWPPLLRHNALFDLESFSEWECHLVRSISSSTDDIAVVLHRVAAEAERLRAWHVSKGPLLDWTRNLADGHSAAAGGAGDPADGGDGVLARYAAYTDARSAYARLCRLTPDRMSPPAVADDVVAAERVLVKPRWNALAPMANRYVAAKAFASWTAYQWSDVRTQIAELYLAASVLRIECARAALRLERVLDRDVLLEAVRSSDLLLMHLVDRHALVDWLRKPECDARTRPPR